MTRRLLTSKGLTPEHLDALLEHGTMADFGPLLAQVRRDPDGPVAERILTRVTEHDYGQTGTFFRGLITQARADRDRRSIPPRQG